MAETLKIILLTATSPLKQKNPLILLFEKVAAV
jgi:hypothetical protein